MTTVCITGMPAEKQRAPEAMDQSDASSSTATETTTKSGTKEEGSPSSATSAIQAVKLVAPGNLDIYLPNTVQTRVYRKRNHFYIDVNAENTYAFSTGLFGNFTGMHSLPWRSQFMYMNANEFLQLNNNCVKYRYKECSIKFSNMMTHTGTLGGTSDPHINMTYNGVMCYAGISNARVLGPYSMVTKENKPVDHGTVHDNWSDADRQPQTYREWNTHVSMLPQVKSLVEGAQGGSAILNTNVNLWDTAYAKLGDLPIKEFTRSMTERRWRNALGYTRMMGTTDITNGYGPPQASMYGGHAYPGDGDGYVGLTEAGVKGAITNGRFPNFLNCQYPGHSSYSAMIADSGQLGKYFGEDIDPDVSTQSSIMYNDVAGANISSLTHRNPYDLFYFGFSVPKPTGQDPHVYVSFTIESELEVEYVNEMDINQDLQNMMAIYQRNSKDEPLKLMDTPDGMGYLNICGGKNLLNGRVSYGYNRSSRVGDRSLQSIPITINQEPSLDGNKFEVNVRTRTALFNNAPQHTYDPGHSWVTRNGMSTLTDQFTFKP